MNARDEEMAPALARADQQVAHIDTTLVRLVADATELIAEHGETGAWALLGVRLVNALSDCPQFLAEMLARMAIKEATR